MGRGALYQLNALPPSHELQSADALRCLLTDMCQLMGVNPTADVLQSRDRPTSSKMEQGAEVRELLASLLVRLIGMEVPLP